MGMQMLCSSAYQYEFLITVSFQRQLQNVLSTICVQSWIYWGGNYTKHIHSFCLHLDNTGQHQSPSSKNSDICITNRFRNSDVRTKCSHHPPFGWYCNWMAKNRNLRLGQRFVVLFIYFYLFKSLKCLEWYCLRLYLKLKRLPSSCLASF
jgi:hypothetical protein